MERLHHSRSERLLLVAMQTDSMELLLLKRRCDMKDTVRILRRATIQMGSSTMNNHQHKRALLCTSEHTAAKRALWPTFCLCCRTQAQAVARLIAT